MATTETKTGFRLPWSQDHPETDDSSADAATVAEASDTAPTQTGGDSTDSQETERPDMIDATAATDTPGVAQVAPAAVPASPEPAVAQTTRKPNKLMADLAKAMQTAAEGARADTLDRFAADAKTHIEAIQNDAATEAADLRRQADDDIAGVRDWSKAEISRIREETEHRITGRKTGLDGELDEHAASTERRIARVQARVDAFEAEMAYFFEVLLAEEDPTKLASMAQSLPEPPDFDDEIAEPAAAAVHPPEQVEPVERVATDPWATPEPPSQSPQEVEAALEAIAAAAQAADVAEAAARDEAEALAIAAEAEAGIGISDPEPVEVAAEVAADDPRMAALGLSPDAAAEAEAASFEASSSSDDDIPIIADDALAARIAGLVPDADAAASAPKAETISTRVVVVGLVSVASIAGFKRHLGRVAGVQSVGVSSGPDGEFVFVVTHGPEIALRDAIATLPGFGARVTGESDEGLQVTAKDPEAES